MKKIFLFAAALVAAMTINAEDAVWNFSEWDDCSGFTNQVKNNLGLFACAPDAETQITNFGVIEANAKTFDDGFEGSKRFKLNGGGFTSAAGFSATPTQRYLHFNVNGESTIKVWYLTGGSGERTLYITDGTNVIAQNAHDGSSDKLILQADYYGGPATIYIFADKACNLFKIEATNVGTTTQAIDNVEVTEKAVKTFENGQLVIIKNGVRYNALGAKL